MLNLFKVKQNKGEFVKVAGVTFKVVNELPQEVIGKLVEALQSIHNHLQPELPRLGGGACGQVFDLGGYALKIDYGWDGGQDGKILEDLQGCPFIPKLYMRSENKKFTVMQKIDGQTVASFCHSPEFSFDNWMSEEDFKRACEIAVREINDRGWAPEDMHHGNLMIDREGKFWIVDVGLFSREINYSELGSIVFSWNNITKGLETFARQLV